MKINAIFFYFHLEMHANGYTLFEQCFFVGKTSTIVINEKQQIVLIFHNLNKQAESPLSQCE